MRQFDTGFLISTYFFEELIIQHMDLDITKIYSCRKILRIGFPTETILNTWCSKAVLQTILEQDKTIEEITIFDFSMICLSFC